MPHPAVRRGPLGPYFEALSDRIGRRKVYIAGALFQAILAVPSFLLLQTGQFWAYVLGMTLGLGIGHGAMYGAQGALFSPLYPVNVRYTGLSVTQQTGAALGGGLSPLLGTAPLSAAGGQRARLIVHCVGVAVVSAPAGTRPAAGEAPAPTTGAPAPHLPERTQVS
ncbi:MFS transporter [Streptomyces sp. NPDC001508]|uniref:MFS transporter n=1 Tax=Streptomyces sp. NPDC001508 TaxID=3154656 RepID=UPI003323B132